MALNLVSTVYEEDDANDDATDQEGRDFLSGRRQITPSVPSSPPINNPPDDCRVNTEDPTIAEFLPPADESPNLPYYLRDVPCSNLDLPRASLNVVDCLPHLRMPSSDVFAAENKSVSSKDTFRVSNLKSAPSFDDASNMTFVPNWIPVPKLLVKIYCTFYSILGTTIPSFPVPLV